MKEKGVCNIIQNPECIKKLTQIETNQSSQHELLEKICTGLYGNGKPGLISRMERQEEIEERRKWLIRALIVAFLSLGVVLIKELVKGNENEKTNVAHIVTDK